MLVSAAESQPERRSDGLWVRAYRVWRGVACNAQGATSDFPSKRCKARTLCLLAASNRPRVLCVCRYCCDEKNSSSADDRFCRCVAGSAKGASRSFHRFASAYPSVLRAGVLSRRLLLWSLRLCVLPPSVLATSVLGASPLVLLLRPKTEDTR